MADWVRRTCEVEVVSLASEYPVVTLTGPRQAGKTTLCRMAFGDLPYANLEHPETRAYAADDPNGFLANYPNGAKAEYTFCTCDGWRTPFRNDLRHSVFRKYVLPKQDM